MTSPDLARPESPRFASSSNALSTDAEMILPLRHGRIGALIRNTDASITVYIGDAAVNSSQFSLPAGASLTITSVLPVFAVAASGTPTIAIFEEYA